MRMKLLTLGRLELRGSSFKRAKSLLLIAYLSLEGQRSREHVAELFWQGSSSRQRRNNLSKALSDLRSHAPGSLDADDTRIWSLVSTDVADFQKTLDAKNYAAAVKAYTGTFFMGHLSGWNSELEEWIFSQREQLAQQAQAAQLELAECLLKQRPQEALKHARAAFRIAEPEVDILPRFYQLFKTCHRGLTKEVQDLARGYDLMLDASLPDQIGRRETQSVNNLPTQSTSFVGRNKELSQLVHQLSQPACRLLSLVGIGGVGKSRLAVQGAYELLKADPFGDGIYFVQLDALTQVELMPSTVAESLGAHLGSQDAEIDQLIHYIGTKELLLILDNFEHLIDGAALISELLQHCPHLKVMVTSREPLNLAEEWHFPLKGLALPDENLQADARYADAVQLFIQRATQVQLSFELTPDDVRHVLKLCHFVAGSPLALELAAVWTKVLSPEALIRELERSLDILSGAARNRSERHVSLRVVFERSWALLSSQEQTTLKNLSVFRGGFTRAAAVEVAGASLATLASLVDKSLLKPLASGRYERHPLLYQYTREKLEADRANLKDMQERHFSYFLAIAERAEPLLNGPEQKTCLEKLEQDHENFRAALARVLEIKAADKALNLSGALWWFWYIRGYYTEGRNWLDSALALSPLALPQAQARALKGVGSIAVQQGDYDLGRKALSASLSIFRKLKQPHDVAASLNNLASISYHLGDYLVAANHFEEAATIFEALGDKRRTAGVLCNLGRAILELGDLEKVRIISEKSLRITQDVADEGLTARTLIDIGRFETVLGNYPLARSLFERGLNGSRELGYKISIIDALLWFGDLERREGKLNQAQTYLQEALSLQQELGLRRGLAETVEGLAYIAADQEKWQRSTYLLGAVEVERQAIRTPRMPSDQPEFEQVCNKLFTCLGEDTFNLFYSRGRVVGFEKVMAHALNVSEPMLQSH